METYSVLLGPLCGEFTRHRWIPLTKTSDAGLWCFFFFCAWANAWINNRDAVIWDAIAPSNESLIHSVKTDTLEFVESFRRSIKHYIFLYILSCIFYLVHYKLHFSSRESCIKLTILVCGWCRSISNNSKYQMRVFPLCFPNFPKLFRKGICVSKSLHCNKASRLFVVKPLSEPTLAYC